MSSLRQAHLQTPRGTLPYLFKPSSKGTGAPLVVFLHGAKDRGDDLSKLLAWGFPKFAASSLDLPYHWLALQIPEGSTWPQWQEDLFSLVDILQPEHGSDKVVLAGFSLGSAGAWLLAESHSDRVAGLVIVSGRLPEALTPVALARLRHVPTWIFHKGLDDKSPVSQALETFDTLRKIGTPSRLTLVADGDHFIADQVYASGPLQEWLSSKDKAVFPPEAQAEQASQASKNAELASTASA
jgi:predicted peptidase